MPKYSLRRISASEFVKRLRLAEAGAGRGAPSEDKRYAFFLGAGCSFTSGIPTAGGLVRDEKAETDWLRRYRDLNDPQIKDAELDQWAKRTLKTWNKESPASSYGELIDALFLTQGERQREIERLCNGKVPNFGYTVLSSLMSRPGRHFSVVLTTNFDDLLAEAFFRFQSERLMIINHDSLAPFIRPTQMRPLLVKLHGDHRLMPRNTGKETDALDKYVSERVSTVLHDRGLVFVGYGGNDESILRMLEGLPEEALPFGVYWVSGSEPRGTFRRWLEQRDAVWVEHQDFDWLMLLIKRSFDIPEPTDEQFKRALTQYRETEDRLNRDTPIENRDYEEINDASAWLDSIRALRMSSVSPDLAELIFKAAVKKSPHNAGCHGNYATFLKNVRKDYDAAEKHYRLALDADSENADNLGNYAIFLETIRKNREEAENYYRLAIKADPENQITLGNYALFLNNDHNKLDEAEKYYRLAVTGNVKFAFNLGNYAKFLTNDRQNHDEAEKYYRLAVEAEPKHAINLGNYALFLKTVRQNHDEAEKYYQLAVEADWKNANNLGNYALFLKNVRQNNDAAEKYFRLAVEADPEHVNNVANYSQVLFEHGRTAEGLFHWRKALVVKEPHDPPDLDVELMFYGYAHAPTEERAGCLSSMKKLLEKGVRSKGWDFSRNVERATKIEKHPAKGWLAKLAAVCNGSAEITTLEKWKAWRDA